MNLWCSLEDFVNVIVEGGAVPVLVKHLQAPPYDDGDEAQKPFEHSVEKGSAYALAYLAIKVLIHTLHSCCYFLESICLFYSLCDILIWN